MTDRDIALFSPEWFSYGRSLVDAVRYARSARPECSSRPKGHDGTSPSTRGKSRAGISARSRSRTSSCAGRREAATAVVLRELRGAAAMQATIAAASTAEGSYVGPPAPCNLAERPELRVMPAAPGATLEVQYVLRRGPFGDVGYRQRFVDGRLEAEGWGRCDDPAVVVDMNYRSARARARRGVEHPRGHRRGSCARGGGAPRGPRRAGREPRVPRRRARDRPPHAGPGRARRARQRSDLRARDRAARGGDPTDVTISFAWTLDRIGQQVDDDLFTKGAQMTIEIAGERVFDVAIGDSGVVGPMTPDHVFRVYCTIKPVTTLAIAWLVEDGAVDLDGPLEVCLPELGCVSGGTTLRHVLTHTAGLIRPQGVEMEMVPPSKRWDVIARSRPPRGWRLGVDWATASTSRGTSSDSSSNRHRRAAARASSRLDTRSARPDLDLGRDDTGRAPSPPSRGWESTRSCATWPSPRCCSSAARRLHRDEPRARRLHQRRAGPPVRRHPRSAGRCHDRRDAGEHHARRVLLAGASVGVRQGARPRMLFGLGFMTELREHAFGDRCGPRSFGHSRATWTCSRSRIPSATSRSVVLNGMVDYEAASLRRRALVNTLYSDLEDHDAATRDDASIAKPEVRGRFRRLRRGRAERARCKGPESVLALRPSGPAPCRHGRQETKCRPRNASRRARGRSADRPATSRTGRAATSTDRVVPANMRDGYAVSPSAATPTGTAKTPESAAA